MSNDKPLPPGPPARLIAFRVRPDAALPQPFHSLGLVEFDRPAALLYGFHVAVRGSHLFLVSPRGWKPNLPSTQWKADGKRRLFGPVPMSSVTLVWEAVDEAAVDKLQRYDSPPMEPPKPQGEELPQIDPKEMGDP